MWRDSAVDREPDQNPLFPDARSANKEIQSNDSAEMRNPLEVSVKRCLRFFGAGVRDWA
jgi:hypothetical protein